MSQHLQSNTWDIIVLGGGASGMMAAGVAARNGKNVLLIEKNQHLGKKLLISGGGRCNVMNGELDENILLKKYKKSEKFLYSSFSKFGVKDTFDFFHLKNMPTKEENAKRIFPQSNSAQSVWDVLFNELQETKVTILSNSPVIDISENESGFFEVRLLGNKRIFGKKIIVATGGLSHPETGSTGDGFLWLKKLGHTIITPSVSLVPIKIKESYIQSIQGLSFDDIKITLFTDGVNKSFERGKVLFTHFGLSGPAILLLSKQIGESLSYSPTTVHIDFFPTKSLDQLDNEIKELLLLFQNSIIKNSLSNFLPKSFSNLLLKILTIDEKTFCHSLTRDDRKRIVSLLKKFPLTVSGLMGIDKAVITNGGVPLTEIDTRTFQSKLHPNLYIIGDMLDIDRPTGGYSLQLCWTSGYIAGTHAAEVSIQFPKLD